MRARLVLCLFLVLTATAAAETAALPLAQAEQELEAAAGLPAKKDRGVAAWRSRVKQLEAAFRAATVPSPRRAYAGLGKCQLLLGRYAEAAASYRRALGLASATHAAAADLRRARQLAAIARRVRPLLPKGSVILEIAPFQTERKGAWLVLSATLKPKQAWSNDDFYEEARLRLFRETKRRLAQAWRSEVIQARPGPGWTNDLRLYVLAERPPKVVVGAMFYGAGWAPAHVEAFAWQGQRLAQVLALDSEESYWIEDLDRDGRHEIGGFRKIGSGLAIADMPRWSDIYAYEGGRYVLANERFPKEFVGTADETRRRLEEHPDNWELLKYLGIYHEIQGDGKAALDAYRRAQTVLTSQQPTSSGAQSELTDIGARIKRLGG